MTWLILNFSEIHSMFNIDTRVNWHLRWPLINVFDWQLDTVARGLTGEIFTEPFQETFLVRTYAVFCPLVSRGPYHLAHSNTRELILLYTWADTCTSVHAAQIKPLHSPPFPGNKSKWRDKIEKRRNVCAYTKQGLCNSRSNTHHLGQWLSFLTA